MQRKPLRRGGYVVAGLGSAGGAALELLSNAAEADPLVAWDSGRTARLDQTAARWTERGVEVFRSHDGTDALDRAGADALVVKSPGLKASHSLITNAKDRGLDVIDELELAWRAHQRPFIGITGTNGKSTTSKLIATALGDGRWAGNTEIGVPASAAHGEDWLVCEVSSFQLEFAPTFLPQIAVFTNLTRDHIPWHGSFAEYFKVKSQMFVSDAGVCGHAVINIDDRYGEGLAADVLAAGGQVTTFGFGDAAIQILETQFDVRSARIALAVGGQLIECDTLLPGRYNALNFAAALGAAMAAGEDRDNVVTKLATATPPPGRFESIDEGQAFDVIVDYAHNGDGIEQLLSTLATVAHDRGGELRTIFGPLSLPDPEKARESAEAAGRISDHITLTPGLIVGGDIAGRLGAMRADIGDHTDVAVIADRSDAIERTLRAARPGDVVALLGHGTLGHLIAEDGTVVLHDDREVARTSLANLVVG